MSDEPQPDIELMRVHMRTGQVVEVPIPRGGFASLMLRICNDGMLFTDNFMIPFDMIAFVQRIEATQTTERPLAAWPFQGKPN